MDYCQRQKHLASAATPKAPNVLTTKQLTTPATTDNQLHHKDEETEENIEPKQRCNMQAHAFRR